MNEQLIKWLKFLCSKKNFHNLCISYPLQIDSNQYSALNLFITNNIIEHLTLMSQNVSKSYINSDLLIFDQLEGAITTKELEQLDDFSRSSALYLPSKIIIICGPKNLSLSVSNKILKILEDPPVELSFIMLGYSYSALLPTIRSRFLNWRIPLKQVETYVLAPVEYYVEWQQLKTTEEFEKWATNNNVTIEQCLSCLWNLVLNNCHSAQKLERTLSFQQWFDQSQFWSSPLAERWYFLFQMVKNSLQSKTAIN